VMITVTGKLSNINVIPRILSVNDLKWKFKYPNTNMTENKDFAVSPFNNS
jgi:hypothetical protein